ncbi:MAG TPA: M28 family peptidase [Pyrinomonadaceae bacterium]
MHRFRLKGLTLALLMLLPAVPLPPVRAQQQQQAQSAAAATPAAAQAKRLALTTSSAARKAAERITAAQMKEDLYWVADDARGGRDTPSAGLDATAKFIADRLAKARIKPAGDDGTYFQKIELRSTSVDSEKTRVQLAGRAFKLGDDFVIASTASAEASGPLVYVGHGWVVRSKNINAYEGLDVKNKIVIVAGAGVAPPEGVTPEYIAGRPASDWESPLSYAEKNGARGVVFVPKNHERIYQFYRRSLGRSSYQVKRFVEESEGRAGAPPSNIPVIIPTAEMLTALFEGERTAGADIMKAANANAGDQGFDFPAAKTMSIATSVKVSEATTQNVVGVIEGSDAKLREEYVAVGAHYDHVGMRPGQSGDNIFNGADDDGSGTVAVLSMAEAFAKARSPKRSVLFVWHAGEEKGLWGSQYFTKFPTVPIKQIVAQLNIDMIGRSRAPDDIKPANKGLSGPDEIFVIGSKMMSAELGEASEAVNRSYLNLKYNYQYDAPDDPEQLFYRSDHYNYAVQGIPIVFYFDGIHEDYHKVTDTPDKIDYQKMQKVTRTVFVLATELANAPTRPVVDTPLPVSSRRR